MRATREIMSAVRLPEYIRARDLARTLRIDVTDVIRRVCVRRNHVFYSKFGPNEAFSFPKLSNVIIPYHIAAPFAEELGYTHSKRDVFGYLARNPVTTEATHNMRLQECGHDLQSFVAVMGHADHGKTSLIHRLSGAEAILESYEEGGITQAVNTINTELPFFVPDTKHSTKKVTFIDTPGQHYFSRMRDEAAG
jgi:hypothetical protein